MTARRRVDGPGTSTSTSHAIRQLIVAVEAKIDALAAERAVKMSEIEQARGRLAEISSSTTSVGIVKIGLAAGFASQAALLALGPVGLLIGGAAYYGAMKDLNKVQALEEQIATLTSACHDLESELARYRVVARDVAGELARLRALESRLTRTGGASLPAELEPVRPALILANVRAQYAVVVRLHERAAALGHDVGRVREEAHAALLAAEQGWAETKAEARQLIEAALKTDPGPAWAFVRADLQRLLAASSATM